MKQRCIKAKRTDVDVTNKSFRKLKIYFFGWSKKRKRFPVYYNKKQALTIHSKGVITVQLHFIQAFGL